jgi:hypothetical protein
MRRAKWKPDFAGGSQATARSLYVLDVGVHRVRGRQSTLTFAAVLPRGLRLHLKRPDAQASGLGGVVCILTRVAIGWNLEPIVIHLLARCQVGDTCEHVRRGIPAFGTDVGAYIEGVATPLLTPWELILRRKAFSVFRTE